MRRLFLLAGLLWPLMALPTTPSWSTGTPAANTSTVTSAPEPTLLIDAPRRLTRQIRSKTVVIYFATSCPHCHRVAQAIQALSKRLENDVAFLGVASERGTPEAAAYFAQHYGWDVPIVYDKDRQIANALGLTATPVLLIIEPRGHTQLLETHRFKGFRADQAGLIEGAVRNNIWSIFRADHYQGNGVCTHCHIQEGMSWELTHHAIAWQTLLREEATDDPACTHCHVTGAGEPSGWRNEPHHPLIDVGCEACHGPGGPHDGIPLDPTTTCETCHDAKHQLSFSLDRGIPLIDHYAANTLTPAAFEQERRQLWRGETPRVLATLPDGPRVGSQACLSCHPEQSRHWNGTPHAVAMSTLAKTGDEHNASCVPCHATPKQSGPLVHDLEGYLLDESVGCESCHGPGGEHVASAGAPNTILGLGESCPVCVIEAVCTTCHTRAMDPDWNLERALSASRHTPLP